MKYKATQTDVGRLSQRVDIEEYTTSDDGMGGTTTTWSTLDTVWADIKPLTGDEKMRLGEYQSDLTHKIKIRYRSDVDSEKRVSYNGRTFNIKYLLNRDEKDAYLEMTATEET